MANTKISADPAATTLTGSEILPVLQGGVNKRTTIQDIISDKDIPVFGRTGGVIDRIVDKNGDTQSGVENVATFSALPTPTGNNRRVIYVDDLKLFYECDGTYWFPLNRSALYAKSTGLIRVVAPAATFTAAAATNAAGAGKIRLTSTGVHGLTNAVCTIAGNPAYIYIAGSTNWPAGLYQIADVDAATTRIDVFGTFVTGMENPTISLVTQDIIAISVPIHKLTPDSGLAHDLSTEFTASVNSKRIKVMLDAQVIHNFQILNSAATLFNRTTGGINNIGATNKQRSLQPLALASGTGSGPDPSVRLTVDTSVATTLTVVYVIATANEYMEIQSFKLHMVA